MLFLIIKSLKIKNFRKIRNLNFNFPDKGLISIVGENESGKSTLLNAIETVFFGFYNKNSKINTYENNYISWGQDEVKLSCEFISRNETYIVTRALRKIKNGNIQVKNKYTTNSSLFKTTNENGKDFLGLNCDEITETIEKITGFNRSMFTQLIYVKQHDLDALKKIKQIDRKSLLDKLIGLENIRNHDKEISEKIKGIKNEISDLRREKDLFVKLQDKLFSFEKEINKSANDYHFFEKRKKDISEKIRKHSDMENIENKLILSLENLKNEIMTLINSKNTLKRKIENKKNNMQIQSDSNSVVEEYNPKTILDEELSNNFLAKIDKLMRNLEKIKQDRIFQLNQNYDIFDRTKNQYLENKENFKEKNNKLTLKKEKLVYDIKIMKDYLNYKKNKVIDFPNLALFISLLFLNIFYTLNIIKPLYFFFITILILTVFLLRNSNYFLSKFQYIKMKKEHRSLLSAKTSTLESKLFDYRNEELLIKQQISKINAKHVQFNQNLLFQDIKEIYTSIEKHKVEIQGIKALKSILNGKKVKLQLENRTIIEKIKSIQKTNKDHMKIDNSLNFQRKNEYSSKVFLSNTKDNINSVISKIDIKITTKTENIDKLIENKKIQLVKTLIALNSENFTYVSKKRLRNFDKTNLLQIKALKLHLLNLEKRSIHSKIKLALIEKEKESISAQIKKFNQVNTQLRENKENLRLYRVLKAEIRKSATIMRKQILPLVNYKLEHLFSNFTCDNYNKVKVNENLNASIWVSNDNIVDERYFSGGTQHQLLLALRISFSEALLEIKGANYNSSLFLDECFSSSDYERKERILKMLKENKSSIFSQIFIITHDNEITGDYQLSMQNGVLSEI